MCLMDTKRVKKSIPLDAISTFPDEILAKILSFLPTKQAACTSILSKRWRNLFPLMTHLFSSQHHFCLELVHPKGEEEKITDIRKKGFMDFVDKTLSGSNSIKRVSLKFQRALCRSRAKQWIHNALERGVMDFDLDFEDFYLDSETGLTNHLSHSLFTSKTLVKLTIAMKSEYVRTDHFQNVSLPELKSLVLHTNFYHGPHVCEAMLRGCPILEELSFRATCRDNPDLLISHKALKRLTVFFYGYNIGHVSFITFDTPSLVYLDYSGYITSYHSTPNFPDSLVANFPDSLVELKLNAENVGNIDKSLIMNWICNVKTLSLSSASVKMIRLFFFKRLPLFTNLIKLSFESCTKQQWRVLPRMLKKSPKLETLALKGLHSKRSERVSKSIHECEVKVLEIYGFKGSGKELRQVKYFLRKMKFLQVMKVEIDADETKKVQLMKDIHALPNCSSNCKISFL